MPEQKIPSPVNMNLEEGLQFLRLLHTILNSSVARREAIAFAIILPANMQNKQKYRIFSAFETVFCTGIDSKNELKHILKPSFRGGGGLICQK